MQTLAEILSSPFVCNFVHNWGKWGKEELLDITRHKEDGETRVVGWIAKQNRTCHTCGKVQYHFDKHNIL